MNNKFIFIILIGVLILPNLLWAATTAEDATGLEQISPEELQQLQDLIRSFEENPTTSQAPSTGNDFQLDIVWKAYTLTPFDYPGKALPGALSQVVFYALASVPNPEKLTYSWIIDDSSSTKDGPELAGRGQDRFSLVTFQIPEFTHELRVMATNETTGQSASAAIQLKNQKPEVNFYLAYNNNYNNLSPDTITFSPGEESSLMARPFYFNTLTLNNLDFEWLLDNQPQEIQGSRMDILPIKITERTASGTYTNLKLELKNKKAKNNVFERVSNSVGIAVKK